MPRYRRSVLYIGVFGALALSSGAAWSLQGPPIMAVEQPAGGRTLIQWEPGEVRCGGMVVTGQPIRRPWNQMGWIGSQAPRTLTLHFAIDASGRPVSLSHETPGYMPFAEDVAPALAASRFAPGEPRDGCTITFTLRSTPLAQAAVPELVSYTLQPLSGVLPEEGWKRIREAGGTCLQDPQPQPLERHFPDFATIPATPGVRDWSMVRYDLDAAGKPRALAILTGTGNRALDAAALKAIRESRFTKGARTGCLYPYWRGAAKLPAPDMPEAIHATKVEGGTCPDEHGWAVPPQLRYPHAYRRRSIEGWAVVRYDVAPWGETGNWKVVAAQPSDDFGTQAVAMIRAARLPTNGAGYTGCVDRVRFVMGPERTPGVGGEGAGSVPVD